MSEGKADLWLPLWVGDYLAGTSRLTTEQHGAYLLLLMDYWRNGAPPDDDACLSRIARLGRSAWTRQRPVIEAFFRIEDGHWRNKRLEAEIASARDRSARAHAGARRAASQRWRRPRDAGEEGGDGEAPPHAPRMPGAMPDALPDALPSALPGALPSSCPSPSPSPAEAEDLQSSRFSGAQARARDLTARAILRATIVGETDEGFARSYFDPAGLSHGRLTARTDYAARKLRALKAMKDVEIVTLARPRPSPFGPGY